MFTTLLLAPAALAAPDKTVDDFGVALTASIPHLIGPALELNAEFKLGDRYSVSALGGVLFNSGVAGELGAQIFGYPLGDFRGGLMAGAELLVQGGRLAGSASVALSNGDTLQGTIWTAYLSGGPLVGGKYSFDSGLTLAGQGGLGVAFVRYNDGRAYLSQWDLVPLINLQLGWAF